MTTLVENLMLAEVKHEGRTSLSVDEARLVLADINAYEQIKTSTMVVACPPELRNVVKYFNDAIDDIASLANKAVVQTLDSEVDKFKDTLC